MKIRSMRVKSAAALALAASLGLAACSSDAEETPAEDTTSAEETSEDTSSEGSDDSGEPVQIDYIHRLPDGEGMTLVNDIVAKWNEENPNIQVTATKWDGAAQDLIQKLETDVKANNAVCLAQVGYGEIPEVYVKGLLEDVSEYSEQYKDNFSAGAYNLMGVDGKIFGLPQDTGPLVYFYDTAAFEELGIELPTNAEELQAAAETAAAAGKNILSFQPDEAGYWLSGQAAAAGDAWFTPSADGWAVDTNGAGAQKVAEVWQGLLDADAVLTAPRWEPSWNAAVADGTLIGTIGAAWEAPLIAGDGASSANAGKWAVVELPDWFGNGSTTGSDGGSGVAVMKGCEHPAEAMEFNNWFNTQVDDLASQGLVVAATTSTPATPEAWGSFFGGGEDPMTVLINASANMSDKFIYMPGWSSVTTPMVDAAAKAADGSGKVADIFTAAGEAAVTTLTDLGLPVVE